METPQSAEQYLGDAKFDEQPSVLQKLQVFFLLPTGLKAVERN